MKRLIGRLAVRLVLALLWLAPTGCRSERGLCIPELIGTASPLVQAVAGRASEHRLQILVTPVPAVGAAAAAPLEPASFRADEEYFYPASTIKLCAVVAAVRAIERIEAESGAGVSLATPLVIHPLGDGGAPLDQDQTNLDGGRLTVGHEIRKIGLVSDNPAFNRLYDLVGPEELNRSMHELGLGSVCIGHRLSVALSAEDNRRAPRVDLLASRGTVTLPPRLAPPVRGHDPMPGLTVGHAYMRGDSLVHEPMDFTFRNRISLRELHELMVLLVRPDLPAPEGRSRLDIADHHRKSILSALSEYPGDSPNPRYDRATYPDEWGKPLLPGLARVVGKDDLRIVNKIGQAYGFTIDTAYVEHVPSGRAFFATIALYTNADGILNDDRYEYDSIALPFLADLGESLARRLLLPADAASPPNSVPQQGLHRRDWSGRQ